MSQSHLNMSQSVIDVPEMRVRGVIDLRAYAANPVPTRDWLTGRGTPAFADDDASVVSLAPVGEGRVQALPGDEFLIVISGTLTLESNPGVTVIDTGPPAADLLVGPTPSCRNHSDYLSTNGEFVCGTWDSTPYHRRSMLYRHIELMHLLDGSVTFEDATGSVTFAKGDIFLAMRGAECAWISHVHVKKVYAIHRPA
jgi:uncharacterized cupin superfamily protein